VTVVLGIETSCDETAAAVVEDGRYIRSNVVFTQEELHRRFGGVVPELASREHVVGIIPAVEKALAGAGATWDEINAVAVSYGPGLAGSLVVIALPGFWMGLVLLYLFAYKWPVFPLGGKDLPLGLILPAVTLGLPGAAWTSRVMRSSAYEVLSGDAVRGLRAKGLTPRTVLLKHTLRAAAGPVLTILALDLGFFLGGAVLIESVFNWPGLGLASYQALQQKDIPLLMGCVITGSVFILLLNLITDVVRTKVDPRVSL